MSQEAPNDNLPEVPEQKSNNPFRTKQEDLINLEDTTKKPTKPPITPEARLANEASKAAETLSENAAIKVLSTGGPQNNTKELEYDTELKYSNDSDDSDSTLSGSTAAEGNGGNSEQEKSPELTKEGTEVKPEATVISGAEGAQTPENNPEVKRLKAEIAAIIPMIGRLNNFMREQSNGTKSPEMEQQEIDRSYKPFQAELEEKSKHPGKTPQEKQVYEKILRGWQDKNKARNDFEKFISQDHNKFLETAKDTLGISAEDIIKDHELMEKISPDMAGQLIYKKLKADGKLSMEEVEKLAATPGGIEALSAGLKQDEEMKALIEKMDSLGRLKSGPAKTALMTLYILLFLPFVLARVAVKGLEVGSKEFNDSIKNKN